MNISSLEPFFNPSSVAVIGASNSPFNLGGTICNTLKTCEKLRENIYAVNTKGEDVHGCPGYTSIKDIPAPVELAIIIVAAKAVPAIVHEIAEKGTRNIIIESAGFSEMGEEGKTMQAEINKTIRDHNIRVMGPNCLGVLNSHKRFCCFYGAQEHTFDRVYQNPGSISYVIQSGGLGVLILESFATDIVNVNKLVSIGNKTDVDEADMIDYFSQDETEVIGMFLENVTEGRRMMEAARKCTKPILIYKSGRTSEGARAAMSHTAGMANNDRIFNAACRQSGIIRLKTIDELHSMPKMFTSMPLLKGKNIAVITNSGAFGGIIADLFAEAGLSMVRLKPETQEKLSKTGKLFNTGNPVDIGPAILPETFLKIYEILLQADEVDGLLPIPSVWQEFIINTIVELQKMCNHYQKPAATYTPNAVWKTLDIRSKYLVPIFQSPEEAVRALQISYFQHLSLQKKLSINSGAACSAN
ncbi:MAG TPA: CoA-binding protein [Spirochaetota bacterium]|nr:CoA-binding protein [Spirochaetota bacterium]HPR47796.1 CoA-binding protein [Spirochaetota bacterium]